MNPLVFVFALFVLIPLFHCGDVFYGPDRKKIEIKKDGVYMEGKKVSGKDGVFRHGGITIHNGCANGGCRQRRSSKSGGRQVDINDDGVYIDGKKVSNGDTVNVYNNRGRGYRRY